VEGPRFTEEAACGLCNSNLGGKDKTSAVKEKSKLETAREAQKQQQLTLELAKDDLTAKTTLADETKEEFTNKQKELEEAQKKEMESMIKLAQAQAANKSDEETAKPAGEEGQGTGEGGQDAPKEPQEVADARKAHDDALAAFNTAQEMKKSAEKAKTDAADELIKAQSTVNAEQKKLDECSLKVKQAEAEDR